MRLQKYITEKFAGASLIGGNIHEIFRNPDSKEMKEIHDSTTGSLGYIIDIDKRSVYIGVDISPDSMVVSIQPTLDIDYKAYIKDGFGIDNYIMFSLVSNNAVSEEYQSVIKSNSGDSLREILDDLEDITNVGWVSKWIQPSIVSGLIKGTINDIKRKL